MSVIALVMCGGGGGIFAPMGLLLRGEQPRAACRLILCGHAWTGFLFVGQFVIRQLDQVCYVGNVANVYRCMTGAHCFRQWELPT